MPNLTANPTPITPPRVALLDERTGLITREWYMFFLSLFRNVSETGQVEDVSPDVSSELASYDAALRVLANEVNCAPPSEPLDAALQNITSEANSFPSPDLYDDKIFELQKEVHGDEQAPSSSVLLSGLTQLQQQVEGLQLTPPVTVTLPTAYASLYDTNTQTAAAGTDTSIIFNSSPILRNFSVLSTTRLTAHKSGVYLVTLQAQFYNASAANDFVYLWLRINSSNTLLAQTLTVPAASASNGSARGNTTYMLNIAANDVLEAYWQTANGTAFIAALYPSTVIPGAMLTITLVPS